MMNTRLGQLFGLGPKKGRGARSKKSAKPKEKVPGAFGNKLKKKAARTTPKSQIKSGPKGPTPTPRIFDGTIRINKRIKDLGLASRRDADRLIESKKVLINGVVASIGSKVTEADKIEIVNHADNYQYYSFYKPKDVVSHSPQFGETEVKNFFKNWDSDHLTIVGRLDKLSEGLMLVTNDKRLVERILDPRFGHERTYEVTVQEKLSKNIVSLFAKGFNVQGRFTAKPAKVELVDNFKFRITLTEGKKHQIRLMTNDLHYTVSKLKRTNIMNLNLKGIEPGKFKEIKKEEVQKLLKLVGLR